MRAKTDVNGSPEYVLTWKQWDMPRRGPICALRGRQRRTSDNDFTGWPTPIVNDELGSTHCYGPKVEGETERLRFLKLPGAAKLYGWPTARAEDSESTGAHRGSPDTLTSAGRPYGWATTTTRDHKDGGSMGTVETNGLLGRQVWAYRAQMEKPGVLNPHFSLWLMGYPPEWGLLGERAMLSFRKSPRNSSKRAKKRPSLSEV